MCFTIQKEARIYQWLQYVLLQNEICLFNETEIIVLVYKWYFIISSRENYEQVLKLLCFHSVLIVVQHRECHTLHGVAMSREAVK